MNIKDWIKRPRSVLVIAEIGANHDNNYDITCKLIDSAKSAGADYVKFQVYRAAEMCNVNARTQWNNKTVDLWALYRRASMHKKLLKMATAYCKEIEMPYFVSVFNFQGLDWCEQNIDSPIYKISAMEANDTEFIDYVRETDKTMFISDNKCVDNKDDIIHFDCVSEYPAKNIYLRSIKYGEVIGLSDHSQSIVSGAIAVGRGYKIIEKHIKLLEKNSVDNFAIDYIDFKGYVYNIREAEKMIDIRNHKTNKPIWRRSLYARKDIKAGEIIQETDIEVMRPFADLEPKDKNRLIGQKAVFDIKAGSVLSFDDFWADTENSMWYRLGPVGVGELSGEPTTVIHEDSNGNGYVDIIDAQTNKIVKRVSLPEGLSGGFSITRNDKRGNKKS